MASYTVYEGDYAMKKVISGIAVLVIVALGVTVALAHFQALKPSTNIISAGDPRTVALDLIFCHPMEQGTMPMAKPRVFGVLVGGKKHDLLGALTETKTGGHAAWKTKYEIKRPGDHVFYLEPAPYWEPAEGCMIIHYTKVVVHALGLEEGWDAEVGLAVEIVPLMRPYGLWTGNLFRGIVKQNGKTVPYAEIEVEYWNEGGKVKPPSDPFITQVVKADGNGVFAYAMPKAGWWAFAALCEAPEKMENPDGKMVPVEAGGVFWVHCTDMP